MAFSRFAGALPSPQLVPFAHGHVYRYVEQLIEQALVQKLARVISGLRAAALLLDHGYTQEQGVIQRTLDELGEDITFLAAALTNDKRTEMHDQYLDAFYEEEFDPVTGKPLTRKKRNLPRRDSIVAYITRVLGGPNVNPSLAIDSARHISKIYSGFVHGASPHIMDMYAGDPPRFHLSGMAGTSRVELAQDDLWNYFYRGVGSAIVVAKAMGDASAVAHLYDYRKHFEKCSPRRLFDPNVPAS
jgi:hypothetical protein